MCYWFDLQYFYSYFSQFQRILKYCLVKYDLENGEIILNEQGFCEEVKKGKRMHLFKIYAEKSTAVIYVLLLTPTLSISISIYSVCVCTYVYIHLIKSFFKVHKRFKLFKKRSQDVSDHFCLCGRLLQFLNFNLCLI